METYSPSFSTPRRTRRRSPLRPRLFPASHSSSWRSAPRKRDPAEHAPLPALSPQRSPIKIRDVIFPTDPASESATGPVLLSGACLLLFFFFLDAAASMANRRMPPGRGCNAPPFLRTLTIGMLHPHVDKSFTVHNVIPNRLSISGESRKEKKSQNLPETYFCRQPQRRHSAVPHDPIFFFYPFRFSFFLFFPFFLFSFFSLFL